MGNLWIFLLIGLPFLVGAGMGCNELIRRITPGSQIKRFDSKLITITLSTTVLSAVALLVTPEFHPEYSISWLPNTSPMYLQIADSGLVSALVTSAVALTFVVVWTVPELLLGSLVLIACSAANLAFISGHFALRYAALEIAGLCIALLPLIKIKGQNGSDLSRQVYMVLRLGDAGFLVAILMLLHFTGTLDISLALELASSLANPEIVLIVGGLILAVWVKMGLWPFHTWLITGNRLSPMGNGWFYQTLMPNLGLYLLYRIQPLLSATDQIQNVLGWTSLTTAVILALLAIRNSGTLKTLPLFNAVQGSLAVFWAASGVLHITPFIIFLSLLRVIAYWAGTSKSRRNSLVVVCVIGLSTITFWGYSFIRNITGLPFALKLVLAFVILLNGVWMLFFLQHRRQSTQDITQRKPGALSLLHYSPSVRKSLFRGFTVMIKKLGRWLFWVVKLDTPDKLLDGMTLSVTGVGQWISRVVEQNALEQLLRRITNSVLGVGQWLYRVVEQNTLDKVLQWIATSVLGAGRWLYHTVEYASLEGFLQWLKRMIQSISYRLQKMHTGKLRLNLIWVIFSIIIVVITLTY